MLIEDAKKGQKVLIKSINRTKQTYGINKYMEEMVGKIYTIDQVILKSNVIHINGWGWRPEDISLASEIKNEKIKIKPQLFDPDDLVI